jgi:VIT1/CCC1 family predicted Fe2+/Mn2+ transporter
LEWTERFRKYALDELFDSVLYAEMARRERNPRNRKVLEEMSREEQWHYLFWSRLGGRVELGPRDRVRLRAALLMSRVFGKVFTVKLLEMHEEGVVREYEEVLATANLAPEDRELLRRIIEDEREHEGYMAGQIDEVSVRYLGSLALGMSDAIIELSGVHAGFLGYTSSSLQTGIAGLIVGVSASMSMAAAAYVQAKQEVGKRPGLSALLTGLMYMVTVLALTAPFLANLPIYTALAASVAVALVVLAVFTFYSSVIRSAPFLREFLETTLVVFLVVAAGYAFGEFVRSLGFQV